MKAAAAKEAATVGSEAVLGWEDKEEEEDSVEVGCTNVTQRALSVTQRALSVITQRALNVNQRALSVTQEAHLPRRRLLLPRRLSFLRRTLCGITPHVPCPISSYIESDV